MATQAPISVFPLERAFQRHSILLNQTGYNVLDVPDVDPTGVLDSAPGIQRLIDVLESDGGGCILVPSGQYLIGSTLVCDGSDDIQIVGCGGSSVFVVETINVAPLRFGVAGTVRRRVGVRGIFFKNEVAFASVYSVELRNVRGAFVENCFFSGTQFGGCVNITTASEGCRVAMNAITDNAATTLVGCQVTGSSVNNVIEDNDFSNCTIGYNESSGGDFNSVDNNQFPTGSGATVTGLNTKFGFTNVGPDTVQTIAAPGTAPNLISAVISLVRFTETGTTARTINTIRGPSASFPFPEGRILNVELDATAAGVGGSLTLADVGGFGNGQMDLTGAITAAQGERWTVQLMREIGTLDWVQLGLEAQVV
jgi:hypothetical protein